MTDSDTISFATHLTDSQINQAANLIDSVRPLRTQPSRRKRLQLAPFKVAAINQLGEVVGIAAIKVAEGVAGEAGFLTVRPDFRRQGIASTLTQLRVAHARAMGLHLLYANARRTNVASKNLLMRSGYEYYGDFLSSFGTGVAISWYYLVLETECSPLAVMKDITGGLRSFIPDSR